ncbi:MAG: hypothetical protein ACI9DC_000978 [Gammaproteobacteria bacterium]|jgi:hypothetical protein
MNTMLCFCLRILAVFFCGFCASSQGEEVRGLYEGQVLVSSEDEVERLDAQGRALRQVLGKLSGMASPAGTLVDAAVADPQRFLQQFSYRRSDDPEASLLLWASFEASAVDALVRDAQLPVWSAQRPSLLVWIAVATPQSIELLAPDSVAPDEQILPAINRRAWERGIPVTYPLLDLEDRVRIQSADLWQLERDKIMQASARYGSGAVLVGRVAADGTGAWRARWALFESGGESQWTTQGLSASAAVPGAVDEVADRLSARYAVLDAGEQTNGNAITVQIVDVRTLGDYARALDYLQGLDQVSGLVFRAARNNELRLSMQVRGGREGLTRVAAFSDVLRVESIQQEDETLSFRLLP